MIILYFNVANFDKSDNFALLCPSMLCPEISRFTDETLHRTKILGDGIEQNTRSMQRQGRPLP